MGCAKMSGLAECACAGEDYGGVGKDLDKDLGVLAAEIWHARPRWGGGSLRAFRRALHRNLESHYIDL